MVNGKKLIEFVENNTLDINFHDFENVTIRVEPQCVIFDCEDITHICKNKNTVRLFFTTNQMLELKLKMKAG